MVALDVVHKRYGSQSLRFALESAPDRPWHMRQMQRSPSYNTKWEDLPQVG